MQSVNVHSIFTSRPSVGIAAICVIAIITGCREAPQATADPNADLQVFEQPISPEPVYAVSNNETHAHRRSYSEISSYLCADSEQCGDSYTTASSEQEADWLIRNGYPSPMEQQRLAEASVDDLEREARFNEAATLELARRYSAEGDYYQAIELAVPVARSGNIFAYLSLADIHANEGPKRDLIESGAYLRLAYLLGDHRASELLATRFPEFGQVESVMIDRRATSLYETLANKKAPDPRPYGTGH